MTRLSTLRECKCEVGACVCIGVGLCITSRQSIIVFSTEEIFQQQQQKQLQWSYSDTVLGADIWPGLPASGQMRCFPKSFAIKCI